MEPYNKPIFPHDVRKFLVDNDGRPFWREYYPNCMDIDPHAFFIESPAEIEKYLGDRQGHPIYVYFEKDKSYKPECFVMTYTSEGEAELVMGFAQNIPKNWFKEYNKRRCMKLAGAPAKQLYQKQKEA